jgi:hypothetical protein
MILACLSRILIRWIWIYRSAKQTHTHIIFRGNELQFNAFLSFLIRLLLPVTNSSHYSIFITCNPLVIWNVIQIKYISQTENTFLSQIKFTKLVSCAMNSNSMVLRPPSLIDLSKLCIIGSPNPYKSAFKFLPDWFWQLCIVCPWSGCCTEYPGTWLWVDNTEQVLPSALCIPVAFRVIIEQRHQQHIACLWDPGSGHTTAFLKATVSLEEP